MSRKRALDLVLTVLGAVVWVPTVVGAAVLVAVFSGRPVFYRSMRRVSVGPAIRVVKFRTMVKNAAEIANRDTVPIDHNVRFLNIAPSSPLYTRIGRLLEKLAITELPQLVHVLRGQMSVIGNRPLPENVIACLREEYPHAEDRFLTKAGLTGPAQLVGRDVLSDEDRLTIEGAYCRASLESYSARLDLMVLIYTVLTVLRAKKAMGPQDVLDLIARYTAVKAPGIVTEAAQIRRPGPVAAPGQPKGAAGQLARLSGAIPASHLTPGRPQLGQAIQFSNPAAGAIPDKPGQSVQPSEA